MPKIEVNEEVFFTLADPEGHGRRWNTREALEEGGPFALLSGGVDRA
jgi:hypothetical protein